MIQSFSIRNCINNNIIFHPFLEKKDDSGKNIISHTCIKNLDSAKVLINIEKNVLQYLI